MPRYTIEDSDTGMRLTVEGDSPPTEAEAENLFKQAQSLPDIDMETGEVRVPPPKQKEEDDRTALEKLKGAGETALTLGTGATTGALGAVAGFGTGMIRNIQEGTYGTQEGVGTVRRSMEEGAQMGTSTPRTEAGLEYTQKIGEAARALEPLAGLTAQARTIGETTRGAANRTVFPRPQGEPVSEDLQNIRQTQQILQSRGGTLSAYETQQAGRIRSFSEKIGDLGIISGSNRIERRKRNAEIISNDIQDMINGIDPALIKERGELGQAVTGLIQQGKRAANDIYEKDITELKSAFGDKKLNTKPIVNRLKAYVKANEGSAGSKLERDTLDLVNQEITRLQGRPNTGSLADFSQANSFRVNIGDLLDEEVLFNRKVNEKGDFNSPGFNPNSARELSEVSSIFRETINRQYKSQGFKELAEKHQLAKSTYSQIQDNLFPERTRSLLTTAAKKNDFESVGRVLINANDPTKIRSLMRSATEAFAVLKKNDELPEGVTSPREMKSMIRQSYLNNYFGTVTDDPDKLFSGRFANLHDSLSKQNVSAPIKAVMGDDYKNFTKLTRTLKDASATQKSDPFTLALRSREITSAALLATGFFSGFTTAAVASLGILGAPVFLSKMSTNPKAVDKLLKLRSIDMSDPTEASRNTAIVMEQVINSIGNEEDRKEIKNLIEERKKLEESYLETEGEEQEDNPIRIEIRK